MRKNGLILCTLTALVLTAVAWRPMGASDGQACDTGSRIRAVLPAADENVLATTAGLRYRNCQPRHWHALVVQK
jgi:hypothetical protein